MRLKKHRVFHCFPLKGSKSVTVKKNREQLLEQLGRRMRCGVYNRLALGHEECKCRGVPPTCSLQVRRSKTRMPHAEVWEKLLRKNESIGRDPLLFQLAFSSSKTALVLNMDLLCLWCCPLGSHCRLQSLMVPQESHYSTHLWHAGGCSAEQSSGWLQLGLQTRWEEWMCHYSDFLWGPVGKLHLPHSHSSSEE